MIFSNLLKKENGMIQAKIIADSISSDGFRLTTIECTFHRFILPEINTHRMISKSAKSSRAIPVANRIEEILENPALPVHWGKKQRGMVAENEIDEEKIAEARQVWIEAAHAAVDYARYLDNIKVHKQIAARVLEPFLWQTNVMTSTSFGWENLLRLRDHPDAQPEFAALAREIRKVYEESKPVELKFGEWHLPYITYEEKVKYNLLTCQKASVARVARTSYGNQGGFDLKKDLALEENTLWAADPRHDAPYEMVATPANTKKIFNRTVKGNFEGWEQLRHIDNWRDS